MATIWHVYALVDATPISAPAEYGHVNTMLATSCDAAEFSKRRSSLWRMTMT